MGAVDRLKHCFVPVQEWIKPQNRRRKKRETFKEARLEKIRCGLVGFLMRLVQTV